MSGEVTICSGVTHTLSPPTQAVAVLDFVGAAGVASHVGDRQSLKGASQPVHREGFLRSPATPAHSAGSAGPGGCWRRRSTQGRRAGAAQARRRGGLARSSVPVGDRHAPVAAEGAGGDLDPWGRLAALVLGEIDEADRVVHLLGGQPFGDQLLAAVVELDVAVQDPVEQLIRGQRVLVALVLAQLRGGGAGDDRCGDRRRDALAGCRRPAPAASRHPSCATRTAGRRASWARP